MNTVSVERKLLGKLGNMKEEVEWSVYAHKGNNRVIIQSDKRIAIILLKTKKAMLSSDKGSQFGFYGLSPDFGAVEVDVPEEFLNKIQDIIAKDDGS